MGPGGRARNAAHSFYVPCVAVTVIDVDLLSSQIYCTAGGLIGGGGIAHKDDEWPAYVIYVSLEGSRLSLEEVACARWNFGTLLVA